MSDIKRVALSTIASATAFGVTVAGTGGASGKPGSTSERKGNQKPIRLSLELFATDSSTYPEFNYSKLLHLEKKKLKKLKQKSANGFPNPFEDNDDVARIAKELEKKYGSSYGSGRGRSKKDDHCDIGLGYDESDSFIDNTEAYDEVIPEEVETIEGGFYINCGALEFKELHPKSSTTKTDEIIKMPNRPKKRILSSSSEDSSSSEEDDEDDSENEAEVETEGKASCNSAPPEKRSKTTTATSTTTTTTTTTTTATGKKTHRETETNSGKGNVAKKKDKPHSISISSSNSPKPSIDELGSDSEKERSRQKTVKTTTVKDMLKAKRDNFLKMQEGVGGGETKSSVNGELKGAATKFSGDDSSEDDSETTEANSDSNQSVQPADKKSKKPEDNSEKLRSSDTKLPELDADVLANLVEFKDIVKSKNISCKKFIFDEKLTELFLKIDEACLCIEKSQRNMVFAHLEYYFSLPKYYFLRKAKQLRIKEEKLKSQRALAKLRKAVVETMPGAIANYEAELRKYADLQSNNLNSDNPPKMPKKKFPWNESMRTMLYEVYQVRWTSYPVLRTRKETLEDFITTYMKGKVVQLWPSGWMRYEDLQKEIEKRKTAAKKAKEKKKELADSSANRLIAPAQTVPVVASVVTTTSYMKQFEEFASESSRSVANSDTDSVASSSGPTGNKRKNAENIKQNKIKSQKTSIPDLNKHFNQSNSNTNEHGKKLPFHTPSSSTIVVDISASPTKRTDHSIHNIISSSNSPTTSCNAVAALTQSQQKHSGTTTSNLPPAHVINLDNYKSASDILMTSQQLLGNNVPLPPLVKIENTNAAGGIICRTSSSESDGVEIVGVFPAKPSVAIAIGKNKQKKNVNINQGSRNATSTYNTINFEGSNAGTKNSNLYNSNNNNNAYVKGNKKVAVSGNNMKLSKENNVNTTELDVKKVVKVLEELEQQHKKSLTTTLTTLNASGKEISQ